MENPNNLKGFGRYVSGGDFNSDGFDDVVVTVQTTNAYAIYLYLGNSSGLSKTPAQTLNYGGKNSPAKLSNAGDVNGDGVDDLLVGEWYDEKNNSGTDLGSVHIFYGSSSGLETAPALTIKGTQDNEKLGIYVSSAGDVNGDGVFNYSLKYSQF
ncbi:hypothetical protein GMMP15_1030066 [Candidatus Magnetomoraceae bacterium gMMP-15]